MIQVREHHLVVLRDTRLVERDWTDFAGVADAPTLRALCPCTGQRRHRKQARRGFLQRRLTRQCQPRFDYPLDVLGRDSQFAATVVELLAERLDALFEPFLEAKDAPDRFRLLFCLPRVERAAPAEHRLDHLVGYNRPYVT
jgi:hypothetical protein